MIYYANPSTSSIRSEMDGRTWLGCITTPHQGNRLDPRWDFIADNGCFSDKWTADHWWPWLTDDVPRSARFAVAPDVVDLTGRPTHDETVERWNYWWPRMIGASFIPAFVLQPGATVDTIPDAAAYFIGGDNAWKLGGDIWRLAAEVKRRGAWLHMGRVNSERRMVVAMEMGCDSVDGTYLTFGPDVNLPRLRRMIERARLRVATQPHLDVWEQPA